jgi:hypothetical protein
MMGTYVVKCLPVSVADLQYAVYFQPEDGLSRAVCLCYDRCSADRICGLLAISEQEREDAESYSRR